MAKLSGEASIPEILAEMTVEEKIQMLTGGSFFSTRAMESYGIPAVRTIDGAMGINYSQAMREEAGEEYFKEHPDEECTMQLMGAVKGAAIANAIIFEDSINLEDYSEEDQEFYREFYRRHPQDPSSYPAGILLGATWNPKVVYKVGEALGKEFCAFGYDVCLGPNINLHRDPLNGRLFESYSEDPLLVSRLALAYIKGLQSTGTLACVKHFAANNQETSRNGGEQHISMQALYDLYLPGFRTCVQEGQAASVMSAYNKINGIPCAHNPWLLKKVLREEWGYDGAVISDWGAVYDKVEGIKGGNDLEMPANTVITPVLEALEEGRLSMEEIDGAVANVLRLVVRSNVFKGVHSEKFDDEESRKAAYDAAAEGCVLLKNEGILPLKKSMQISLIGNLCTKFVDSGSGSAKVITSKTSSLYETLKNEMGEDQIRLGSGEKADDAWIITVSSAGQEGSDRRKMDLDTEDKQLLIDTVKRAKAYRIPVIVILNIAGPVDVSEWIDEVAAVLCVFFPGREGSHAAGDILTGRVNPSGKLPLSFPRHYSDCPTAINFPGYNDEVWYGEGVYVGYRYYDFKNIKPQYAFGFGLSYTSFEISEFQWQQPMRLSENQPMKFSVMVENTGDIAGEEVVQVYISRFKKRLSKIEKELKAFEKVNLEPGESRQLVFTIYPQELASYDTARRAYITDPGKYALLIGNASDHICLKEEFDLESANLGIADENTSIENIGNSEVGLEKLLTSVRMIGYQLEAEKFYATIQKEPEMSLLEYLNMTLDISLFASSEEVRRKSINWVIGEIRGTKL